MPEDSKPEKYFSCRSSCARLDKPQHVLHSGADMSVGAADTSVRATSAATAHRCIRAAGNLACRRPFRPPFPIREEFFGLRCGTCETRSRRNKCELREWSVGRRPERPPAGTIACHTRRLPAAQMAKAEKRPERSPTGTTACHGKSQPPGGDRSSFDFCTSSGDCCTRRARRACLKP
jgi:hypothetical protein